MYLVALTGGIAAGKSTVASEFARLGATVIDADMVAREVVSTGTDALNKIRETFGDLVIGASGELDRAALGGIVFGNPVALQQLNEIVHPAVRLRVRDRLAEIERESPDAVVVYDVPLLIEAQVDHPWDLIVVAQADEDTRTERLVRQRGLSPEEASKRLQHQVNDEQRLAVADVVIHTGGTLDDTNRQVDEVWSRIQSELATRA